MSSFVVLPADKREPLFVIVDRVKADCLYNHIPFIVMYVILILDCPFNVFLVLTRFPIAGRFVEYPRIGRWGYDRAAFIASWGLWLTSWNTTPSRRLTTPGPLLGSLCCRTTARFRWHIEPVQDYRAAYSPTLFVQVFQMNCGYCSSQILEWRPLSRQLLSEKNSTATGDIFGTLFSWWNKLMSVRFLEMTYQQICTIHRTKSCD